MIVTPWEVKADDDGVNYDKLVSQFGCSTISQELIDRFERVTGHPVHHLIRRGFFFAHRDLESILDAKEKKIPFYLYTGRGPSSQALHVGHLIPFIINKWLQEVLDCPLVVQLTDDEKFLFKDDLGLEETHKLGYENIKDILACGFNPEKTFIFRNLDYIHRMYPVALKIQKKTTFNQVKGIFGFGESTNIGCVMFPSIQATPSFAAAFPDMFGPPEVTKVMRCLIPCAIDQDPYFRMTRDIAPKLQWQKPSLLLSKFIPALQGASTKMSASGASTAVFVTDTPKQVKTKINKYAFSGGRDTAEEQRLHGADLSKDVPYQYLRVFLEDDDELAEIGRKYSCGEMLTGEIKARLAQVLSAILAKHQEARSKITDEMIKEFCNPDRPALRAKVTAACEAMLNKTK